MPLSEREQRILQEIENNLRQEDPSLDRATRRGLHLDRSRRIKLGGLLVAAGFVLLIAFFVSRSVGLGVLAFIAMVGGIVLVAGSIRGFSRQPPEMGARDRWLNALRAWEERMRNRYKRS